MRLKPLYHFLSFKKMKDWNIKIKTMACVPFLFIRWTPKLQDHAINLFNLIVCYVKLSSLGSCPVASRNLCKSLGETPMVAELVSGWKLTYRWLGSSAIESKSIVTLCSVSLTSAKGVTQPWATPMVSNITDSSANRSSFTPTCLATSLSFTCWRKMITWWMLTPFFIFLILV